MKSSKDLLKWAFLFSFIFGCAHQKNQEASAGRDIASLSKWWERKKIRNKINDRSLSENLRDMKLFEHLLSKKFPVIYDVQGKKFKVNQKVTLENCLLQVENRSVPGERILTREFFDLTKVRALEKNRKLNNTYGIKFGLKKSLKRRPQLHFNQKSKMEFWFPRLRAMDIMCKTKDIKERMVYWREEKRKSVEEFDRGSVGGIPLVGLQDYDNPDSEIIEGPGLKVSFLDGERSLIERVNSIRKAKKTIHIQLLNWKGDEVGKFLADEIIKRRKEGLDVIIIMDGLFALSWNEAKNPTRIKNLEIILSNFMAAGVDLFGYDCGGRTWKKEFNIYDWMQIFRRNHEKIWITDAGMPDNTESKLAIIGGQNVGDHYFALHGADLRSWRDQDVGIKGRLVNKVEEGLMINYHAKSVFPKEDRSCLNPYSPVSQRKKYLSFYKKNRKAYAKYPKEEEEEKEHAKKIKRIMLQISNPPKGDKNSTERFAEEGTIWGTKNLTSQIPYIPFKRGRYIMARPDEHELYILKAYVSMIHQAKKSVRVSNAYFIPDRSLKIALIAAARRGVEVQVISNSKESNDLPMHTLVGRTHYLSMVEPTEEMLKEVDHLIESRNLFVRKEGLVPKEEFSKFMQIYEWQGKWNNPKNHPNYSEMKNWGVDLKGAFRGTFHAKYMLVDDEIGLCGSYNLTQSSEANAESVVIFEGKEAGKIFAQTFENDIKNFAKIPTRKMLEEFIRPPKLLDRIFLRLLKLIEFRL